jgi:hypothetical protein
MQLYFLFYFYIMKLEVPAILFNTNNELLTYAAIVLILMSLGIALN